MIPTRAGWAVVDHDSINVSTVSQTRRAAIVNWLVVEMHMFIHNGMTDDAIEALWRANSGSAFCTTVDINVSPR